MNNGVFYCESYRTMDSKKRSHVASGNTPNKPTEKRSRDSRRNIKGPLDFLSENVENLEPIVERMHPLFVQVVPFCLHEIRPVSGNEYTGHWPNSPILEICAKVVEHSLVKAKARKLPPLPPCSSRVLNHNLLLQLMKQNPLRSLLPSALFEVVVLFSWFCNYLAVQTVFNCLLRI